MRLYVLTPTPLHKLLTEQQQRWRVFTFVQMLNIPFKSMFFLNFFIQKNLCNMRGERKPFGGLVMKSGRRAALWTPV